jgi:hypothetical protein
MIEPRSQHWRRLAGVLRCTQDDDDLSGLSFIPPAPDKNGSRRTRPENEHRHNYDGEYSPGN